LVLDVHDPALDPLAFGERRLAPSERDDVVPGGHQVRHEPGPDVPTGPEDGDAHAASFPESLDSNVLASSTSHVRSPVTPE
jgi:hypothetical protein